MLLVVFKAFAQTVGLEFRVVGQQWFERYLEKRMQCHSAHVDCSYSGGSEHHMLFQGVAGDIFEERRFARAGAAGHEYRTVGISYQPPYILKLGIVQIYIFLFVSHICRQLSCCKVKFYISLRVSQNDKTMSGGVGTHGLCVR